MNMIRPKMLLLSENILKNRVPVYEELGRKYDLTIVFTEKDESDDNVS